MQDVSNSATNSLQTNIIVEQEITFINGNSDENPCIINDKIINFGNQVYIDWLDKNPTGDKANAPGIHPCLEKCNQNPKYRSYMQGKIRNSENCNNYYKMTLEESTSILPGYTCNVKNNDTCKNAFLRKHCENTANYDDIDSCNKNQNTIYYEVNSSGVFSYTPNEKLVTGLPNCFISEPGQKCYSEVSFNEFNDYYCGLLDNTGSSYANCKKECDEMKCTPEEIALYTPVVPVIEGSITLANKSNGTVMNDQTANATTNATMNTSILNQFSNDIVKEITQENSGINFGQFNNSVEMTSYTENFFFNLAKCIVNLKEFKCYKYCNWAKNYIYK
jgi:hypothetical protein